MNSLETLENYRPRSYYESLYSHGNAPWNYARRGGEILRHRRIFEMARSLRLPEMRTLDIGCSLGQLTQLLAKISKAVLALDVSQSAVWRARQNVMSTNVRFLAARLPGLPFANGQFDLVVSADCIHEFLPESLRETAVREIAQMLKPGGRLLVGDYMKSERLSDFYSILSKAGFQKLRIIPLNDRLWYQFESWFKRIRAWPGVRSILASVALAQALSIPARLLGLAGSSHVMILAEKGALQA